MNRRFWLLAAVSSISLALAGIAHAQHAAAGGSVAPHVSAPHARPASAAPIARVRAKAPAIKSTHSNVTANNFVSGSGTSLGFGSSDIRNQDLGIKALIDPATEWRLFELRRFAHNNGFASGFYLLDGGYNEPAANPGDADQSQQASEDQAQQSEQQADENDQRGDNYAEAQPEAEHTSQELPDAGQFVLVLRNGSQIQAVAFTRTDDHIVYITTDGLRRTVAMADLDSNSTVRINQERGTPLQFPL